MISLTSIEIFHNLRPFGKALDPENERRHRERNPASYRKPFLRPFLHISRSGIATERGSWSVVMESFSGAPANVPEASAPRRPSVTCADKGYLPPLEHYPKNWHNGVVEKPISA
jgi:hypothetical protein